MRFTVFTPTYNRAYTLPRLYDSLLKQNYDDFEWLIVDDGSTDNTEDLIADYIKENKIRIRYHKQENQGKHIAINYALDYAKGDYILFLDSDDWMMENCLESVHELSDIVNEKNDFAGFGFLHLPNKENLDPSNYGSKNWVDEDRQSEFPGEIQIVLKREITRRFKFPVFDNEKFCQESVLIRPLTRKYKIYYTDQVLTRGDYLEDGLSQNTYKRILENPKYGMLATKEKFKSSKSYADKLYCAKVYWDIAMKTGGGLKNILNFPLYYTMVIFSDKFRRYFKTKK